MSLQMADSFDECIKKYQTKKGEPNTHTRIAGGAFLVGDEERDNFLEKYYKKVFVDGHVDTLTEKQLVEDGPILIDIDMRYKKDIKTRQHNEGHIIDILGVMIDKLNEMLEFKKDDTFDVYVMEKQLPNLTDEKYTKDGIHILVGVKMHKGLQSILRNKMVGEFTESKNLNDLPFETDWENMFDEGVVKGHSNWQMYGSRKPNHQPYLLTHHYKIVYDGFGWEDFYEQSVKSFDLKKNLPKLMARYRGHTEFQMKDDIKEEYAEICKTLSKKKRAITESKEEKNGGGAPRQYKVKSSVSMLSTISYNEIDSNEKLTAMIEEYLELLPATKKYLIKETYEYTMILPETYYGPGSYTKWLHVGFALSNTDNDLFLVWLQFSSQDNCRNTLRGNDNKFDWKKVRELYNMWIEFGHHNREGLTHRSIAYWAKNDVPDKYNIKKKENVNYYIEMSIKSLTDCDFAQVLFQLYKDKFVCSGIEPRPTWYEFTGNRWKENHYGVDLRKIISGELHDLYLRKLFDTMQLNNSSNEASDETRDRVKKLSDISKYLKSGNWKKNIMSQACELFYDDKFLTKLDENKYLLCFSNMVVDFKNKTHRRGQPDDYLSMTTNIEYIPYDKEKYSTTYDEISEFISQLFPKKELCDYMWDHLASCLIGTNENQSFNVYVGSGRNGKSKLVELMSKGLGDYKGTVPISIVTQKRGAVGGTSSEIAQLKGKRYAVMQEPSKGDQINEGRMKELTGGDPVQTRQLYKESIVFQPQFTIAVCTNVLPEINSNDDGTWRRLKSIDFVSKFLNNPYEDEMFPKDEYPYQYLIDKKIDEKFDIWAPHFMTMLVNRVYETNGVVNDCELVTISSNQYRNGQDYLSEFAKDKLRKASDGKVKKTELYETFKQWYTNSYGRGTVPKSREIYEHMDKKYGKYKQCWKGVAIIYDEDEDEQEEKEPVA